MQALEKLKTRDGEEGDPDFSNYWQPPPFLGLEEPRINSYQSVKASATGELVGV